MYRKKLLSLLLSLAMAATMAFPAMAAENEVTVTDAAALVQAIAEANAAPDVSTTILMEAGTYQLSGVNQLSIQAPGLTLKSASGNAADVTIDINGWPASGQAGILVQANDVTLEGFTVTDSVPYNQDPHGVNPNKTKIDSIKFTNLADPNAGPITPVENAVVRNMVIDGVQGHGINMHHVASGSIVGCQIREYGKAGIQAANATVSVENTNIEGAGFLWAPIVLAYTANNPNYPAPASISLDAETTFTGNIRAESGMGFATSENGLYFNGSSYSSTPTADTTYVKVETQEGGIVHYKDLPTAVKNAPDGATISVYPGEYDIPFDETWTPDYPGASAGWYLPIEQNDLTIQGVDENGNPITDVSKVAATLYSTDLIDTGVWGRQNFVTIFGDNVTLTGLTIMNKFYPNKAMEIMGANATIQYCRFTPTPQEMWPEEAQAELDAWIDAYGNLGSLVYFNSPSSGGGAVTNCLFDRSSINLGGTGDGDFTITNNQFIGKNQYSTTTTYSTIGFPDAWGGNMDISEANILISNNSFENTGRINFSNVTNGTVDISENYWGGGMPADGQLSENVTIGSYYAVQNADGSLDNLITILEDQTDVTTALLLEQQTTDTSKVDVYLTGSDGAGVAALIENLVAVDITFAAADANPLAITSFTPANAEWTYEDYDNGRYLIHEKGMELGSADENGDKILLGTITLGGYGTFSIQATGTAQLRTDDGANTLIEKTCEAGALTVDVTKPQAVLTVNVDFNHNIAENNNADTNDFTITVKGMGMEPTEYRIGNDTGDPFVSYTKDGATFTLSLDKDVSYTVEIAGAGYRTFRQTILMDGDKTLNLWNNKFDAGYEVEVIEGDATTKRTDTFLAGDIVMDYTIGLYDLSAVVSYFGKTTADFADPAQITSYDLNRDGIIDSTDVAMVLVSWEEQ